MRYMFPLTESFPTAGRLREGTKPWQFETLAHNPPSEPGRGMGFSNCLVRNPLKRLDPQK
jgi:hypothetical protein